MASQSPLLIPVVLVVALLGCASSQEAGAAARGVVPQAVPVRNLYRAVDTRDVDLFATVFSQRMGRGKAQRGWQQELDAYVSFLGPRHANFDGYEYGYEGDSESGQVSVREGARVVWRAEVVFDAGAWYLDEN